MFFTYCYMLRCCGTHYILFCICFAVHLHIAFLYCANCPVGGSPQIEKAPVSAASCTFLFFIYLYFVYFRISTNTPSTLVTALVKHCFSLPSTFVEIFALIIISDMDHESGRRLRLGVSSFQKLPEPRK